jgi:hypothetical protein
MASTLITVLQITIQLGVTYMNQRFINIPIAFNGLFKGHNTQIPVYLSTWENQPIMANINRTANRNGTPRIMMGHMYAEWVQANHIQGQNIIVTMNNTQYPGGILIQ